MRSWRIFNFVLTEVNEIYYNAAVTLNYDKALFYLGSVREKLDEIEKGIIELRLKENK